MALELGNNEIHITGVNPKINMEGTEVNAKQLSIRENGGVIEIYDESTGTVVMTLETHASRHAQGGEDEINTPLNPKAYPMLADSINNRPPAGIEGRFFWATDEGILYRDNGVSWDKVSVSDYPDLDEIPSAFPPEAHAASHQLGGADEINVEGLSGKLADPQTPEAHASTHSAEGTDPLSGITASQLASDTIKIVVPIAIPDSNQSDLPADSTGVKWTSNFKFKVDPQNLKSAIVRASWSASNADSITTIEVYDEGAEAVLGSVSGNTGTDAEGAISGFTAGNLITVRLNVTTASETTGATTSLTYVVIELTYGAG